MDNWSKKYFQTRNSPKINLQVVIKIYGATFCAIHQSVSVERPFFQRLLEKQADGSLVSKITVTSQYLFTTETNKRIIVGLIFASTEFKPPSVACKRRQRPQHHRSQRQIKLLH